MLSPKDIETKEFSRSKMGGYKPEEVDDFLDKVLSDYVVLLEERELLNKKINNLTEKIELLRDEQDKWRASILNTQRNYDDVIVNAKKKADKLVYDAQDYAKKLIDAAKVEADRQQQVKSQLTAEVEDFKSKLLSIYENHVKLISSIPVIKKEVEIPQSETLEMLRVATSEVQEKNVQYAEKAPENKPAPKEEIEPEDTSSTIVMPSINSRLNNNAANRDDEPETKPADELRRFSRAKYVEKQPKPEEDETEETDYGEEYKKASKRLVNQKDIDEDDEEKTEKVRGLFENEKPKKGLFGLKSKPKPEKKKKEDDDDDDDEDEDLDDDEFYDDDDK